MKTDLTERLRGPVREAASRLIAGAFRRDGERLDEKRPRFSIPARPDEDDDLVLTAALEEAAAALEAEASEGERLRAALTTALALIDDYLAYRHDGDPWSEDARLMGEMEINDAAKDGRLDAIRAALIPEAPAQEGWRPIETAQRDGTVVWVWCPAYEDLDPLTSLASWHEDAGWCVDELRTPTMWCPLQVPAPPSQDREPDHG